MEQTLITTLDNIEIRKVEKKKEVNNSSTLMYLEVGFEDSDGNRYMLIDYKVEREELYKHGITGKLMIEILTQNVIRSLDLDTCNSSDFYIDEETEVFIYDFIPNNA